MSEPLEIGELEIQSENTLAREVDLDLGFISHKEDYVVSSGIVEAAEGYLGETQ